MRSSTALATISILYATSPLAAQVPVLEPDAPERQFGGCYAVHTTDGRSLFDLPGATRPDTIRLSLDFVNPGITATNRPWRQAFWKLAAYPKQTDERLDITYWTLASDTLSIDGSSRPEFSFRIAAPVAQGRISGGTLNRVEDGPDARPSVVRFERVACPSDEYFDRTGQLILERLPAAPPDKLTTGDPMAILAPGVDPKTGPVRYQARCYELEALIRYYVVEQIPARIQLLEDGRGAYPLYPQIEDPLVLAPIEWSRTDADSTRVLINSAMWGRELVFVEGTASLSGRVMTWSDADRTRRYRIAGTRIDCGAVRWSPPSPRARRFSER